MRGWMGGGPHERGARQLRCNVRLMPMKVMCALADRSVLTEAECVWSASGGMRERFEWLRCLIDVSVEMFGCDPRESLVSRVLNGVACGGTGWPYVQSVLHCSVLSCCTVPYCRCMGLPGCLAACWLTLMAFEF